MGDRTSEKPSRKRSGRAGFSLVELIIALMMMTIGVVAAATLVAGVARTQRRATARTEMTEVGQSKIEELRAIASTQAPGAAVPVELVVGGSLTASQEDHADTVASGRGRRFVRRWVVDNGPAGTLDVTIRVVPLNAALDDVRNVDFHTRVLII